MREDFEAWSANHDYLGGCGVQMLDGRYRDIDLQHAWESWVAARSESEELKIAHDNLYDAIHAMTDSLDYDWEGDWRPEIEKLNAAHMRFSVKYRRTII
jgi:hypothetical protein